MSYPEKNASYKTKPKWLDREERASGGACMTAGAESGAGRLEKTEARAENAEREEPQT